METAFNDLFSFKVSQSVSLHPDLGLLRLPLGNIDALGHIGRSLLKVSRGAVSLSFGICLKKIKRKVDCTDNARYARKYVPNH